MKKLFKMAVACCVLFALALAPISAFAHHYAVPHKNVLKPHHNEALFYNDTSCVQHLKIKWYSFLGAKHHINVDLYPGESYSFRSTASKKKVKVHGHHYHKVRTGDVWSVSSLL